VSGYLRALGAVLLVGGVATFGYAVLLTLGDEAFFRAGRALERHPDHVIFQVEYQAALARHVAYIVTAVVSALIAVAGSAVMFALASIVRRLDRADAARAK
jgi:hypothetical protein